jgi:hypothetical protein
VGIKNLPSTMYVRYLRVTDKMSQLNTTVVAGRRKFVRL